LEQYPQGLGPTVPEIAQLLGARRPIEKTCFSAHGSEEYRRQLQACGRRQLLLAGIETHICVYQTARHLLDEDYYVEIVGDAVSSRTAANKALGIDKMVRAGAQVTSVEMALFELLGEAGTPQFKTIARLVK
jgi:nicotinamidase-related amidase